MYGIIWDDLIIPCKKQYVPGRSSRPEVFCKEGVLRNLLKFIGKHLCQGLFFNKVAGLRLAILLKKRLWTTSFYRTPLVAASVLVIISLFSLTFFLVFPSRKNHFSIFSLLK